MFYPSAVSSRGLVDCSSIAVIFCNEIPLAADIAPLFLF
jgi:hypothetical protein